MVKVNPVSSVVPNAVNPVSSVVPNAVYQVSMVPKKVIFESFYHKWAWMLPWSCDPDYWNPFSYQHPMEPLHMEFGFKESNVLFLGKEVWQFRSEWPWTNVNELPWPWVVINHHVLIYWLYVHLYSQASIVSWKSKLNHFSIQKQVINAAYQVSMSSVIWF